MDAINCLETDKNIVSYITETSPKRVLLCFFHGLGDFLQFRGVYKSLCDTFPDVEFTYGLDEGLKYADFLLDYEPYVFVSRESDEKHNPIYSEYDLIFRIAFTQNREGEMSKAENCLITEVGLPPLERPHQSIAKMRSRLVSVHFYSTWGPSAMGMIGREETAHKIWDEIIEAGLIPIETNFEHKYTNPENENFDWINAHVRGIECNTENLASLLQASHAFIGVISGNIHAALSCLPREKVMALTTYMPSRALGTDVPAINIDNYKEGSVLKWLKELDGEKVKNNWTNWSV